MSESSIKKNASLIWWQSQRRRYNTILIISAPISFISLLLVWWLFEEKLPCLEVNGVSVVLGGILFCLGLVLANIFYFLGPLVEMLVRPSDRQRFRSRLFLLGVGFSLLIIFFPVIGNLVIAANFTEGVNECNN